MRVTTRIIMDRYLQDLNSHQSRMWRLQRQITSGVRLHRPSDHPVDVARSMRYATEQMEIDRLASNALEARDWLEATEASLNEAHQLFHRARELALRGANDTMDDSSRQALVDEIDVLIEHLLQIANTSYKGRYLFGGTNTIGTAPFELDIDANDPTQYQVQYHGNEDRIKRQLGPGADIEINLHGREVFEPAGGVSAFGVLIDLRNAISAGETEKVSGEILGDIDEVMDRFIAFTSKIGARVNRTELAENRLAELSLQIETLNSQLKDADVAEAIVYFRSAEVTLQAALAAGARLIQPTLADFL